jgi:hypothetical protein
MSKRIFLDVEESIAREIRRISFHDDRTLSHTVLQNTFDPITGEIIQAPVNADFYDSSADANNIQYPNFTIKLLKTREDRFSGREVPNYGRYIKRPSSTAPRAYETVVTSSDGQINPVGSVIKTSIFTIRKVLVGQLLRVTTGNNIGTYTVSAVAPSNVGPHSITVSNDLLTALPAIAFLLTTRVITFTDVVDLNTVKIGDNFIDSALATFPITAVSASTKSITIGGVGSPSLAAASKVSRPGNVFQVVDPTLVAFMVLDPSKPIYRSLGNGCTTEAPQASESNQMVSPAIPIDAYYQIRIDSKERANHIDVINRIWEEFNPPRTGLPVIVRNATSFEQLLTADVTTGGSSTVNVKDNSGYELGDSVFVFDDFRPSKDLSTEGFQQPFTAKILSKVGTTQLVLDNIVPDTYLISRGSKVVSNADFYVYMFHFVDHNTKDIDGAQYWVNELTFIVQFWIDRLGEPASFGVVKDISTPIEDLDSNVIIPDL